MDRSEAARLLGKAPKAKRHEHTCPVCGKAFLGTARAVYCSQLCAWRAANHRRSKAKAATVSAAEEANPEAEQSGPEDA